MSFSSPVEKLFITSSRPIRGNQFYFRDVRGLHMNTFSIQSIPWRYSPSLFLIFYSVLRIVITIPLDISSPSHLDLRPVLVTQMITGRMISPREEDIHHMEEGPRCN